MSKPADSFYEFGPFHVDTVKRLVLREGESVALTPKAFDLLLVLLEKRDRVVEKAELMERLWPDSFVEETNLTQNISTLRKALGESPQQHRYIVTIPGRGYRFVADVSSSTEGSIDLLSRKVTRSRIVIDEIGETGSTAEESSLVQPFTRLAERGKRKVILVGVLIAVIAAALTILLWLAGRTNQKQTTAIKSIAVLPFKPINAAVHDEYLELGMADALIAKLSSLKQLIVRPTSAVRKYASIEQDPLAAGREQGVDAVLDANVQKLDDRLRVTVRLLRVADGSALWSFRCEDACTDVFAAQDAISEQIAQAIKVSLSDDEKRLLAKHYTDNKAAYQDYLKGRYYWSKKTPEEINKAISYFQSAIDNDPTYALAYAGLSDAYHAQYIYDHTHAQQAIPRARAAALKALEIDDTLAAAHASLAPLKWIYDWDHVVGEAEFKRAIDLDPNYPTTRHWYALCLSNIGRHEEAIAQIKRAAELDPLSPMVCTDVGLVLSLARRYDEAIAKFHETLEMSPDFFEAHHLLGQTLIFKGTYAEALTEYEKMSASGVSLDGIKGEIGYAYAKLKRNEEAFKILRELKEDDKSDEGVLVAEQAFVYAGLGDKDEAFKLLNRLADRHDHWLRLLNTYPLLDDLHSDARFSDLLMRVGLTR